MVRKSGKVMALVLASCMIMAGCGKDSSQIDTQTPVAEGTVNQDAVNQDTAAEEAKAPTVNEDTEEVAQEKTEEEAEATEEKTINLDEEEPLEYVAPRPICLVKTTVTYQDASGKRVALVGEKDTIKLAPTANIDFGCGGNDLVDLSETVDMIMKMHDAAYTNAYDEAKEMISDAASSDWFPYTCRSKVSVPRADDFVMSIVIEDYQQTGGAHGNTGIATYCLDSKTGKELEIADVVRDTKKLPEMIMDSIDKEVNLYVEKDYFEELVEKNDLSFVLDNSGMTIYFSPYDVAPYSDGIVTASIPFEGNEYFFVKKYSGFTTGPSYAAHLVSGLPYLDYTIDAKKIVPLTVCSVDSGDGKTICEIIIDAGDVHFSQDIDNAAFVEYTYFEYVDCGRCVYAEATGTDGTMTTYVFSIDTDAKTISLVDRLDNMCAPMYSEEIGGEQYFNLLADPEGMVMEKAGRVDTYVLGQDYKPFLPSSGDDY